MAGSNFVIAVLTFLLLVVSFSCEFCSSITSTCDDSGSGAVCVCKDGYVALADRPATFCVDVDECAMGTSDCDMTNGYCVDHDPPVKFECGCLPGYVCLDPNCTACGADPSHPCNTDNGNCGTNAECIPLNDNRTQCKCDDGFVGDGVTCIVLNSIPASSPTAAPFASCNTVNQPGSLSCDLDKSTCMTVNNVPTCVCNSGYFPIGGNCLDINECRTGNLNTCTGGGRSICVNEPGTYRCQCATEFTDFPGSIEGTNCRTQQEIIFAIQAGSQIVFSTGLDGISESEMESQTSSANSIYVEQVAAFFGVAADQVSIGNIVSTTGSGSSGDSITLDITILVTNLFDENLSIMENKMAVDDEVDRITTMFSETFEDADDAAVKTLLQTIAANYDAAGDVTYAADLFPSTSVAAVSSIKEITPVGNLEAEETVTILAAFSGLNVSVAPTVPGSGRPSMEPSAAPTASPSMSEAPSAGPTANCDAAALSASVRCDPETTTCVFIDGVATCVAIEFFS